MSGSGEEKTCDAGRIMASRRWIQSTASQIRDIIPENIASWRKRRRSEIQETEAAGDDGGVWVDFAASGREEQSQRGCGRQRRRKEYEADPLVLVNGNTMVGKTAVAHMLARILMHRSQGAGSLSRVFFGDDRPPQAPLEILWGGRFVVLNMSDICQAEFSKVKKGSGGKSRRFLSEVDAFGIDPEDGDAEQKRMDLVRTLVLSEHVIQTDKALTTVIVTETLPFSADNAETLDKYRTAANVSGRPFVHIYLTCSMEVHVERIRMRVSARFPGIPIPPKQQPKAKRLSFGGSSGKGKGKEKAEGEEMTGALEDARQEQTVREICESLVPLRFIEQKWLPMLFPMVPHSSDSACTSATGRMLKHILQFSGHGIDTTLLSVAETASLIVELMDDVQNGVHFRDMADPFDWMK